LSSEQLLRSGDLLSVPIVLVSADGIILALNKAVQDRLGLVSSDIAGRRLSEIAGNDEAKVSAYLRACARSGGLLPGSVRLPNKLGSSTICRCDGAVVEPSSKGTPASIMLRLFPNEPGVTRFHALNEKIEELNKEIGRRRQVEEALREADRRKNEFLATLAHELRNPLAPIRNALELMRLADGNDKLIERSRGVMERQLLQMVRLVDDLLEISRISTGKIELRKERIELAPVLQSAIETVGPLIERSGHRLTVTTEAAPIYLVADPARLAQVFANLLDNAAKYSERGSQIWLTVEQRGLEVVVSVGDSGIGIPAEYLPHIFEMFSQVNPALHRTQGGLGIGLSLVRRMVELHGGTVEAHSGGLGMGSKFVVRLQATDRLADVTQPPTAPSRSSRGRPVYRILVVEDNRDAADSMAMILEMMGHEVQSAYDGVAGIELAATFRPNLVFLDIGLPGLNGYEVARRIREEPWGKDLVLIALSGWGQEEDKRRSRDAGCDHHLTKPLDTNALEKLMSGLPPPPV
jgi:signal transduction histidine kinase/CheY-like chemotaxis protein